MQIKKIYTELTKLKDLKPSKKVDDLFNELFKFAKSDYENIDLSKKEIKHLRELSSKAEFELESFWCNEIIFNYKKIEDYPRYSNYVGLTNTEWKSLKDCKLHNSHKNILFIGGGPLPMTSIILSMKHKVNITILDVDKKAVEQSKKLIEKLNLKDKIKIIRSNAFDYKDYGKFEIIFVASLVGNNIKEKKQIFSLIRQKANPGTHILTRSTYGKRKLLYQPLTPEVYLGYEKIRESEPSNNFFNSVIVLKSI